MRSDLSTTPQGGVIYIFPEMRLDLSRSTTGGGVIYVFPKMRPDLSTPLPLVGDNREHHFWKNVNDPPPPSVSDNRDHHFGKKCK